MYAAEVDSQAWQIFLACRIRQLLDDVGDADGTIIVDARLLGTLQIILITILQPLAGDISIAKPYGAQRPSHITLPICLATGRISAQQTVRHFLLNIHFMRIHAYLVIN